jgi:membrane-bound ClpP family serine protease
VSFLVIAPRGVAAAAVGLIVLSVLLMVGGALAVTRGLIGETGLVVVAVLNWRRATSKSGSPGFWVAAT